MQFSFRGEARRPSDGPAPPNDAHCPQQNDRADQGAHAAGHAGYGRVTDEPEETAANHGSDNSDNDVADDAGGRVPRHDPASDEPQDQAHNDPNQDCQKARTSSASLPKPARGATEQGWRRYTVDFAIG
jgi:hypothetical protein